MKIEDNPVKESYNDMFKRVKQRDEGAFIPFIVAGDPDFETSLCIVKSMVDGGADALEIGFPFSDPIADGPTVQAADTRALNCGMNTDKGFEFVRRIREFTRIPIGLLVYYNLIYKMGLNEFYRKASENGVTGVLAADLPPEESNAAVKAAKDNDINQIFLAAQTTNNERLEKIVELCSGFLYIVPIMGVTGARSQLKIGTVELVERMRSHTQLPICVGFGISKPEHVREVIAAGADGAIVGSALIDVIADNLENPELNVMECCQIMKNATKR